MVDFLVFFFFVFCICFFEADEASNLSGFVVGNEDDEEDKDVGVVFIIFCRAVVVEALSLVSCFEEVIIRSRSDSFLAKHSAIADRLLRLVEDAVAAESIWKSGIRGTNPP